MLRKKATNIQRRDRNEEKKLTIIPYITMFLVIPLYNQLDQHYLVEKFGCGCQPSPNANDIRAMVSSVLTILLIGFSLYIAKVFKGWYARILYCLGGAFINITLATWVIEYMVWM